MTKILPPAGDRAAVVIIGNRNAGKSSLINRLTGQDVAIVSEEKGTTTDPVLKPFELIPVGPVSLYDTAGLDDDGSLGTMRVKATEKVLERADLVLIVIGKDGVTPELEKRMRDFKILGKPFIPVFNFADVKEEDSYSRAVCQLYEGVSVSAQTGLGIDKLIRRMGELLSPANQEAMLLDGLVVKGETVVLVTPIDNAAPKGRLILPQVKVLREVLDAGAMAVVTRESELETTLKNLRCKPALVITDSQAVKVVSNVVAEDVPLTTFSMLFARAKGDFSQQLKGAGMLEKLPEDAEILIAEGCSHHVTCDDIGRVKLPQAIDAFTGKKHHYTFVSGYDFPENLKPYSLIIHCGGCMLNRAEIQRRMRYCEKEGVAVTNYGMVLAVCSGVLARVAAPLD